MAEATANGCRSLPALVLTGSRLGRHSVGADFLRRCFRRRPRDAIADADAMEQDTEANRTTAPPEHHALLEQTAKSNAVACVTRLWPQCFPPPGVTLTPAPSSLEWDEMKEMLKTKLADVRVPLSETAVRSSPRSRSTCQQAISDFLSAGPPWPLAPEEASQARERAYDTLDSFSG